MGLAVCRLRTRQHYNILWKELACRSLPAQIIQAQYWCLSVVAVNIIAALLQDVLIRMKDSVVGALNPDFFEKTTDNADL